MLVKNFTIPEQMFEKLQNESGTTGLTMSEIVRRAIDNYLEGKRGQIIYQFNGGGIEPPYIINSASNSTREVDVTLGGERE